MYNIGLVVGNVEDPFSNQICKGAMRAAEIVGDNLFIFPVKYLNMSDAIKNDIRQQFEYQYNFLLAYAQSHSLDMVLLCLSTIAYCTSHEEMAYIFKSFGDIPVLLVASDEEGCSSIMYDNVTGLKDGINYLIENRGCKHIGMLSGNLDNKDAAERLQVYKDVLAQKGLKQEEKMIVYGDLSDKCTTAVEELLKQNSDLDAIVCANDSMAKAVYRVLDKYHFQIGKDICVLGFDDLDDSVFMNPPLATVRADASAMGYRAMMEAHSILEEYAERYLDRVPVRKLQVETSFVNRESASGQKQKKQTFSEEMNLEYQAKIQRMIDANHCLNIITRDMLMYCDGGARNFSDFLTAFRMESNTCCYLFMLEKPLSYHAKEDFRVVENMYLQAYRVNDKIVEQGWDAQRIRLDDLFHSEHFEKKPKNYIIIDIYSREKQYGIMVCDMSYDYFPYVENLCYQISMATKIIDLLQVQEQLLVEKEVMVQRLEQENLILDNISNKDELTGINNRRGFITKAMEMLKDKSNFGRKATIIYADLNYLKLINDRYSHAEGNFAIQSCAKVLDSIMGEDCVAGRIGGDEFALFCMLEHAGDGELIKAQLCQNLEGVNSNSQKPYEIAMSIGVYEFVIEKDCDLKELLTRADEKLYEDKAHKKPFVERG
ncbi:MAG: GGDEF domain-containing protein [Lachnospiraceae bacterium]|nr:GGDEF domain-containing protein [Lachnospiraceae bacterium]